ncbi:L37A1 protein, partial [Penelope pileata]|nr:L37A1 protein [Penelope pileata]
IPNSSRAAAQPKETHGVGGAGEAGVRAAPSPRQGDARASEGHRQQGSPQLNKAKQLSSQVLHKVNPDKEPPPTKSAAEQRPTTGRSSSSSRPTASSTAAAPAGTASLHTTIARSEHPKKGPDVPSAPSSSGSPEDALLQGDLFESNVKQHLLSPVPNEALRAFIARVGRALRVDCLRPPLQPSCSKLLAQTRLLVELLGLHRSPSPAGRCLLPENAAMARGSTAGSNLTGEVGQSWGLLAGCRGEGATVSPSLIFFSFLSQGKPAHTSGNRVLLALSVSLIIVINVTVVCLIEVSRYLWHLAAQPGAQGELLPPCRVCEPWPLPVPIPPPSPCFQGSDCSEQNKPQWLRDLYLPLDDIQKKAIYQLYEEEPSEEEEDVFNKAELM